MPTNMTPADRPKFEPVSPAIDRSKQEITDSIGRIATVKPGTEGTVILTAFGVNYDAQGLPHHEQIGNRITIANHPDDEHRPETFLAELRDCGELGADAEYLIVKREWIISKYGEAKLVMVTEASSWGVRSSFERLS